MSQMVGVQAATNVLLGERYKSVGKEIKSYIRGEYGQAPGSLNPELVKKVLGDEKPCTGRFADTLEPMMESTAKELEGIARNERDVLSYIAFPPIASEFFTKREQKEENRATYTIEEI